MNEQCSVTDESGSCPRPVQARGWCKGHWQRWNRDGDPGPVEFRRIRKGAEATCSVEGCGDPHQSLGFCGTHYYLHRTGNVARPVRQQAAKVRLTDHEMGLLADSSLTGAEAAQEIGITASTVNRLRRQMGFGVLRVSDWTDYEIDFVIENLGKMKTERMAGHLNRTLASVDVEIKRLRRNGVVLIKRTSAPLDPWIIAGRPLIAKTCSDCGLFLSAEWFPEHKTKAGHRDGWSSHCKKCRKTRKYAGESAKEKWAAVNHEYLAKVQAYTLERAENHGDEWTSADIEVLADPSKTVLEKALELKRTYHAVKDAQSKHGFAAKRERLGDPHDSAWKLFWEIEDLAVAS